MTHARLQKLAIVLALVTTGCASASLERYRPKNTDEAQLISILQKIPNGINGKSLDILMQPYADDVYIGNFHKYLGIAGPRAAQTVTKADLRAAYSELFQSVKALSLDVRNFQLTLTGDRATVEARMELLLKLEGGRRQPREDILRNDVTWRLRRTPAGWKIVEEIYQ